MESILPSPPRIYLVTPTLCCWWGDLDRSPGKVSADSERKEMRLLRNGCGLHHGWICRSIKPVSFLEAILRSHAWMMIESETPWATSPQTVRRIGIGHEVARDEQFQDPGQVRKRQGGRGARCCPLSNFRSQPLQQNRLWGTLNSGSRLGK